MKTDGLVHRLIIPEVLPEDTGEFVCEAYNDYGDTDTFCFLTVRGRGDNWPHGLPVTEMSPGYCMFPALHGTLDD